MTQKEIEIAFINFNKEKINLIKWYKENKQISYYLAGLLEGDGHISLPSLGITTLKKSKKRINWFKYYSLYNWRFKRYSVYY